MPISRVQIIKNLPRFSADPTVPPVVAEAVQGLRPVPIPVPPPVHRGVGVPEEAAQVQVGKK